MHLRDLEYFKYLAESLSFTKTAEHFFVSQPSISIALKRLEDEFETVLIHRERSARSIALTSSGHLLYQRTIDMLSLFNQTKREINAVNVESIQLGLIPLISNLFLPRLLANTNDQLSELKLIKETSSQDVIESLRSKKYSTAILAHIEPTLPQQWLSSHLIAQAPLKLWLSKNHPLAKYRELSILELKNEAFISFESGSINEILFHQWATQHQLPLNNIFYSRDIHTLTSLIASGQRVGLFMDSISLNRDDLMTIPVKNAPIGYISLAINNTMEITEAQSQFNHRIIQSL